jgi:hypothetical protein
LDLAFELCVFCDEGLVDEVELCLERYLDVL